MMESINKPLVVRIVPLVEENIENYSQLISNYLVQLKNELSGPSNLKVNIELGADVTNINEADLYIIGTFEELDGKNPLYSNFIKLYESGLCSIIIFKFRRLTKGEDSINHLLDNFEVINFSKTYNKGVYNILLKRVDSIIDLKNKYRTPLYHKVGKIIKNAKNSRVIDLSNCALQEIPKDVFNLTNLEELIIDKIETEEKNENKIKGQQIFNNITEIPNEIKNLKKLIRFILSGSKYHKQNLSDLGGLIGHPNLKELDLSFCSFTSTLQFNMISSLEYLNLRGNNIFELRLEHGKLPNLKKIIIENNNLNYIHDEKSFQKILHQLEYINLKNNPINLEWLNPAMLDASGDNKDEILELLTLSLKGLLNRVDTLPQKIIVLGNSEVGKTELSKVLIKDKGQFPDKDTTHGLKIRQWELGAKFKNKSLFIYDFGGQDFYHSVYNMFFTFDTIYIIVWDDKRLENQSYLSTKSNDTFIKYNPSYWLKNIQYFLNRDKSQNFNQHIEIISLHNSFKSIIDYQYLAINMDGLNHHFTLNLKETSKQLNRIKIDLLKQSIFEICNQFDDKFSLSHNDIDIFNHVLKVFKENNYKKYLITEFYQEFGTPDYTSFLKVLHQKGIVFYLSDHDLLKDYVWINPSTISERIYQIMDKAALLNKGEISENEFDSKISQDIDLKNLLIHQEILFRDDSEYMSKIIVPQYLPLASTDDFLLELASEGMETLFAIRFQDFMPHGLMSRLMCRLGRNPGRKVLKRNEFICRLCISLPEEKTETIKISISCDMVNLKLHVKASKEPNKSASKYDLQKYLFKVVLAAYWNQRHLEIFESPKRTGQTMVNYLDPLWEDSELYKFTSFDFEISNDNEIWVDYGNELFSANTPIGSNINPILNGKKYYYDMIYIDDYIDQNTAEYKNPLYAIVNRENPDIIEGYVEEIFQKVQVKALFFNPFITNTIKTPKKVFVSYAHADTEHRLTLQKYLVNLQRENLIEIWHDGLINLGDDWDEKIIHSIEEADIVILLVSQSFIASSYIYNTEMPKALGKVIEKKGAIFPFILENCDWKRWKILMPNNEHGNLIDIGKYQGMPIHPGQGNLQPLESNFWTYKSDAWMVLVEKMRAFWL